MAKTTVLKWVLLIVAITSSAPACGEERDVLLRDLNGLKLLDRIRASQDALGTVRGSIRITHFDSVFEGGFYKMDVSFVLGQSGKFVLTEEMPPGITERICDGSQVLVKAEEEKEVALFGKRALAGRDQSLFVEATGTLTTVLEYVKPLDDWSPWASVKLKGFLEPKPLSRQDSLLVLESAYREGSEEGLFAITVDPAKDFRIVLIRTASGNKVFRHIYEDFRRTDSGEWLPWGYRSEQVVNGQTGLSPEDTTTLLKIEALRLETNVIVPQDTFQVRVPPGAPVRDFRRFVPWAGWWLREHVTDEAEFFLAEETAPWYYPTCCVGLLGFVLLLLHINKKRRLSERDARARNNN